MSKVFNEISLNLLLAGMAPITVIII